MHLAMLLLMILILVISCETVKPVPINVPEFAVQPSAPILITIPEDLEQANTALTINLSRLDGYTQKLELYITHLKAYYSAVILILAQ